METLTITEAAKVTGVSRSTLYRYIKKGKLSRGSDGKVNRVDLQRAGFKLLNPEMVSKPPARTKHPPSKTSETAHLPVMRSPVTPLQQSSTPDGYLGLIHTLRNELASAKERERLTREEARREQERLMILLAQAQYNVQQLLAKKTSQPHSGYREPKLRLRVHMGMAGIMLIATSLFSVLMFI